LAKPPAKTAPERASFAVAAVIPACGAAPGLADAVESALRQTPKPEEIIVVDDGLTPGSRQGLYRRFGDEIRVLFGTGRGAGAARNVGLRAAYSNWVALLDADDVWLPGYLAGLRNAVARNPLAGACFSGALHVTEDGRSLARYIPAQRHASLWGLLRRRLQPTTSATAVSRKAALSVGGFFEGFEHPAGVEDIDLWWRVARRFDCVVQPAARVVYVVHQQRDRSRSRAELTQLSRDRALCIARLRGQIDERLLRAAAAEHHAVMARYWYLAGFSAEGFRHALRSIRWRPTVDGAAAVGLGLLPPRARQAARQARYRFTELCIKLERRWPGFS
jgi:GT2 family glycosyltransferase